MNLGEIANWTTRLAEGALCFEQLAVVLNTGDLRAILPIGVLPAHHEFSSRLLPFSLTLERRLGQAPPFRMITHGI
jgi:hypothetical protein